MTNKLMDPAERAKHNTAAANKLKDPAERAKDNAAVADKVKDPAERAKHNERQLKLVTEKRIDSKEKMRHNLAELERYRTMRGELKSVILKYISEIDEGPTFVCSCCGCLHFRKTVVILKREKLVSTNVCKHDFVKQVFLYETVNVLYVCKTCLIFIKDGRVPKIALCRGLTFPEIPHELCGLTMIKQRLVSPRHEFMNIRSLGRERQHGLHGMVVNVPMDVNKTVNQLPRTFL